MLTEEISSRTQQLNVWGGCLLLLAMVVLLFVPLGHDAPEGSSERNECQSILSGARSWQDQDETVQDYSSDSEECAARRTAVAAILPLLAIPTTLLFVLAMRPRERSRTDDEDEGDDG